MEPVSTTTVPNVPVQTAEPGSRRRTVLTFMVCLVVAAVVVAALSILDSRKSSSASPPATEACRMYAELQPVAPLTESHRRYQEIYEASRGAPEVRVTEAARELAELSSPVAVPIEEAVKVGDAGGRLFAACRAAGAFPE